MAGEKQLLMTMTGEIHQPVRLYYQAFEHWQGHTDYTLGDIIRQVSAG